MNNKARVIGIYLPQYHPFPENDEWWGKGFTEWVNVVSAKPLFKGHYQPHVPGELGFYDLRIPELREQQATLAREAGIEGFCYWHYWFGDGKRLMEMPFNEVVKSGKPNFPFCLAWANHSWYAKTWDNRAKDKLLIEQKYDDDEGIKEHFMTLLPAFKDPRYICIDDKPIFMVFKPLQVKNAKLFIDTWNKLAVENGLKGIYFIGQCSREQIREVIESGYDAVNHEEVNSIHAMQSSFIRAMKQLMIRVLRRPRCYDYSKAMKNMLIEEDRQDNVFPTLCPNFDHTPRSGARGLVLTNSTPRAFYRHIKDTLSYVKDKDYDKRVIFVKSWNEWGEGNYMEPDRKFGKGYIEAMRKALDEGLY